MISIKLDYAVFPKIIVFYHKSFSATMKINQSKNSESLFLVLISHVIASVTFGY